MSGTPTERDVADARALRALYNNNNNNARALQTNHCKQTQTYSSSAALYAYGYSCMYSRLLRNSEANNEQDAGQKARQAQAQVYHSIK